MNLVIDEGYVLNTLVDLVKTNSVNPMLVPDAPGEREIGSYISDALARITVETMAYEVGRGRVNIVGIMRGTGGGRSLMLNGHMDTVGVYGMSNPFSADIHDGRVYGRGSHDMKGGLAAMKPNPSQARVADSAAGIPSLVHPLQA